MKLVFEDLSFSYKSHRVFEHISYTNNDVRMVCLIGANGAGKTTLLKCINGIHSPSSGRVLFNGEDVGSMSLKKRASIFGYVPQFTSVNPCLNVLEMVISGRMPQMMGKARPEDIEAAEEILIELGLQEFALRPFQQLSGGERQRVLMARALAQDPRILLLDEPTSNLDLHYQLETMELVKKTVDAKGIGVVAVIHDLNAVLRYADEAILLNNGSLLASGAPKDIINEETLSEAFRISASFTETAGISVMVPVKSVYQ